VGKFEEARASICFECIGNAEETAKLRAEVQCPADAVAFAMMDFVVKPDADDEKLGESLGMLETILDSLPYDRLPIRLHHSHKVDVIDLPDNQRVLRVLFFSPTDPCDFLFRLMGRDSSTVSGFLVKGQMKVELPVSLDEFLQNPMRRLSASELALRLSVELETYPEFQKMMASIIRTMDPVLAYEGKLQLACFNFARNVDMLVQFADLQEMLDNFPVECMAGGAHTFKCQIETICKTPIRETLFSLCSDLHQPVQAQRELYTMLRQTLLGLSRVELATKHVACRITAQGLNFVPFFPDLDAPSSSLKLAIP